MIRFHVWVCSLITWPLFATIVAECPREGGPHPLIVSPGNLSKPLLQPKEPIQNIFGLSGNSLFVQDALGDATQLDLSNGQSHSLGKLEGKWAHVAPKCGYLASEDGKSYFNLATGMKKYIPIFGESRFIFWNDHFAYIVAESNQRLWVGKVDVEGGSFYPLCRLGRVQLAQGHEFPQLFYYTYKERRNGSRIEVNSLDVTTCEREEKQILEIDMPIEIKAVARYEKANSTAVYIGGEDTNLLWQSPEIQCRYYSVKNMPIFLHTPIPSYISYSESGIDWIQLNRATRKQVFNFPVEELKAENTWYEPSLGELFFAPQIQGFGTPVLKATQRVR